MFYVRLIYLIMNLKNKQKEVKFIWKHDVYMTLNKSRKKFPGAKIAPHYPIQFIKQAQ